MFYVGLSFQLKVLSQRSCVMVLPKIPFIIFGTIFLSTDKALIVEWTSSFPSDTGSQETIISQVDEQDIYNSQDYLLSEIVGFCN